MPRGVLLPSHCLLCVSYINRDIQCWQLLKSTGNMGDHMSRAPLLSGSYVLFVCVYNYISVLVLDYLIVC